MTQDVNCEINAIRALDRYRSTAVWASESSQQDTEHDAVTESKAQSSNIVKPKGKVPFTNMLVSIPSMIQGSEEGLFISIA